jgi:recombination protein RecA
MGEGLDKAMAILNKTYGEGAVFKGTSAPLKVDVVPTGSLALDLAIGVGGIPRGRITEIYGREGSSKTTLIQHVIANGQRMGLTCALIDVEHAIDRKYAEACGVNFDDLIMSQPESAESALEIAEALVRSGEIGVVALDSVAALVPAAELEGSMEDQQMGAQARIMGKCMRKIKGAVHAANCAMVLSNQVREKVGAWSPNGQVVEVTPGGRALKFQSSLRIEMKKVEDIKDGRENVGIRVTATCKKNKVAPPLRQATIEVYYGVGFAKEADLLQVATDLGIIKKGGSWLTYNETRWHGREDALLSLRSNAELLAEIDSEIRKVM